MEAIEDVDMISADDLVEYSDGEQQIKAEEMEPADEEMDDDSDIPVATSDSISKITSSNSVTVKRIPATQVQKVIPKMTNLVNMVKTSTGKFIVVKSQRPPSSTSMTPTTTSTGTTMVSTTANSINAGPVKVLNTVKPAKSLTGTTSYRLVKTDGSMLVKPNMIHSPQQTVTTIIPKRSVAPTNTTGDGPSKLVLNSAARVVAHPKGGGVVTVATGTPRTGTVASSQQLRLSPPRQTIRVNNKEISVTKAPVKIVTAPATGSTIRLKPGGEILPSASPLNVVVKPAATMTPKTSVDSQKMIIGSKVLQMPQHVSGQLQAINIPGKGMQYVRVVSQTKKPPIQPSKVTPENAGNGTVVSAGSKFVIQNKTKTFVLQNGGTMSIKTEPGVRPTQVGTGLTLTTGKPTTTTIVSSTAGVTTTVKTEPTVKVATPAPPMRLVTVLKRGDKMAVEVNLNGVPPSKIFKLKGITVQRRSDNTQMVILPPDYLKQLEKLGLHQKIVPKQAMIAKPKTEVTTGHSGATSQSTGAPLLTGKPGEDGTDTARKPGTVSGFPEEAYKKRPCNCTRSQCLKLYCDCFANGEYCYNCNCKDCLNNLENEDERQKAIRATLERNPSAFKPKIGSINTAEDVQRLHTKGCNCKRSGCLKNYCECYEAKIACSNNCKCYGCKNTEQYALEYGHTSEQGSAVGEEASSPPDIKVPIAENATIPAEPLVETAAAAATDAEATVTAPTTAVASTSRKRPATDIDTADATDLNELSTIKQPYTFMTPDVVDATVQCMVAQGDECQKRGCNMRTAERMILEEVGRCLLEIIEFSTTEDS